MTATDTVGLIIAGAIGAGGAVTAQIIASVVTGLKDTKRFNWEREKQEREWKNHEREQFLAHKQQLYAEYLVVAEALIESAHYKVEYGKRPDDEVLTKMRRLGNLRSNISLIAPERVRDTLVESHDELMKVLPEARKDHLSTEQRREAVTKAMDAWWNANRAMRADLLGEEGSEAEAPPKDNRP